MELTLPRPTHRHNSPKPRRKPPPPPPPRRRASDKPDFVHDPVFVESSAGQWWLWTLGVALVASIVFNVALFAKRAPATTALEPEAKTSLPAMVLTAKPPPIALNPSLAYGKVRLFLPELTPAVTFGEVQLVVPEKISSAIVHQAKPTTKAQIPKPAPKPLTAEEQRQALKRHLYRAQAAADRQNYQAALQHAKAALRFNKRHMLANVIAALAKKKLAAR